MPVRSFVPVRITVDPAAVLTRRAALEDALEAALGRALAHCAERVIAPRGGYVGVTLHPPSFHWRGPGLGALPAGDRRRLEQSLRRVIDATVERSGVLGAAQHSLEAAWPLHAPEGAAEALAPERLHRLLRRYRLPSYQQAGDEAAVAVEDPDEEFSTAELGLPVPTWGELSLQDVLSLEDPVAVLERVFFDEAVRRYGTPSGGDWLGLMWRDGDALVAHFTRRTGSTGEFRYLTFPMSSFREWVFKGADADPAWVVEVRPPEPAPATLRQRGTFSAERAEDAVRAAMGPSLLEDMRRHAQRLPNVSEAEFEQALAEAFEAEIARRGRDLASSVQGEFVLLELEIGPKRYFVPVPPDDLWQGEVKLLPISYTVFIQPGDEGEGEGRGRPRDDGGGADGTGGERGGRTGGFVHFGAEATAEGGRLFVPSAGSGATLACHAYLGEPDLEALGEDGADLKRQIEAIATLLGIGPCEHPGRFCLNAAVALEGRAYAVGEFAVGEHGQRLGFSQPPPPGGGNFGGLQFTPVASPAIQFLRHFAQRVPEINRLARSIDRIYERRGELIRGTWHGKPISWMIRFGYDLNQQLKSAVQVMFVVTCRVLMLQLLETSHKAITDRLTNFATYAPIFERLVVAQLADLDELRRLHARLDTEINASAASAAGRAVLDTWRDAHHAMSDLFAGRSPVRTDEGGEFVRRDGQPVGIRDRRGGVWSLAELEQAIALREGTAEGIDPLVKQLSDIEGMLHRFERDPFAIRRELRGLLEEMQAANAEVTSEVKSDWRAAFETGRIAHDIPSATLPGGQFALQGIHLQAHHMIGEFFRGDLSYLFGVELLLKGEHSLEIAYEAFTFVGLTLLAVVCAPAAIAAGAALASYEYYRAGEREEVFRALIDPELVISRAEIEAELFAAELGLALSFVPYAGRALRSGARGAGTLLRQGVRAGARDAARATARTFTRAGARGATQALRDRFSRQVAEQLKDGVARALVIEVVSDQLMDQLLTRLLFGPALEQIQREFRDFSVSGTSLTGRVPRATRESVGGE